MVGLGARHRREVADEALVRQMFEEHGNAMLAYAIRLTGDRGAAEDVFQEALVRAWRHPDGLSNGKCNARTWLLSVVDNVVSGEPTAWRRPKSGRYDVATLMSADQTPVPHVRLYRTWRRPAAPAAREASAERPNTPKGKRSTP
ncbi:MAG TPA: sigma factor [Pseudonocardiaceae bacterium]|jgi:DNA-directed RNA polymerase specialized sigma24 family protein|nr:sigma factor [Pseudonocardiaceae bacterium]